MKDEIKTIHEMIIRNKLEILCRTYNYNTDEFHNHHVHGNFRQEDGNQPHSASGSVNGELPPLSRTGSPTTADKDILVCINILPSIIQLELIQHFRHSTNLKLNEKLSYIGLRK
jgi:hypothetical protein